MLLDINIAPGVWVTFGTPIIAKQYEADELNAGLHRILLEREKKFPQMRTGQLNRSNLGGWRSEPDLLSWQYPEIGTLKQMFDDTSREMMQVAAGGRQAKIKADYNLVAWANINRHGSYNVTHNHPGNHWSGVYYVSIGKPEAGRPLNGIIEFQDPRPAAAALPIPGFDFGNKATFEPRPGMMLIFPSWHLHMVHPFFGDGERISIAFNLRVESFEVLPGA